MKNILILAAIFILSSPAAIQAQYTAKNLTAKDFLVSANYLFNKGEIELAIAEITIAIKMDPGMWEAVERRGKMYMKAENWDDAIADFTRLIEIRPDYVFAYLLRAEGYNKIGRKDKAKEDKASAKKIRKKEKIVYQLKVDLNAEKRKEVEKLNEKYPEDHYIWKVLKQEKGEEMLKIPTHSYSRNVINFSHGFECLISEATITETFVGGKMLIKVLKQLDCGEFARLEVSQGDDHGNNRAGCQYLEGEDQAFPRVTLFSVFSKSGESELGSISVYCAKKNK